MHALRAHSLTPLVHAQYLYFELPCAYRACPKLRFARKKAPPRFGKLPLNLLGHLPSAYLRLWLEAFFDFLFTLSALAPHSDGKSHARSDRAEPAPGLIRARDTLNASGSSPLHARATSVRSILVELVTSYFRTRPRKEDGKQGEGRGRVPKRLVGGGYPGPSSIISSLTSRRDATIRLSAGSSRLTRCILGCMRSSRERRGGMGHGQVVLTRVAIAGDW